MIARQTIAARVVSRWWLILILTLIGAGVGYTRSMMAESMYQATTTLLIGRPLTDAEVDQDAIETSQRLASTYADLVGRQPVLQGAATQLGLDVPWQDLRDRVHASVPQQDAPLVLIRTEAASSGEAASLAGAVSDQVIAMSPTTSEDVRVAHVRSFVDARLRQTEQLIAQAQARTTRLRAQIRTANGSAALDAIRSKIVREDTHLLDLQQNYASLLGFISSGGVTNYVEVLEPPEAGTSPVRPSLPTGIAAGALLGFALGVILASVIGGADSGRREPHRPDTSAGSRIGSRVRQDADHSSLGTGQTQRSVWFQ